MGLGYTMRKKVMAYQKERARNNQYKDAAEEQIKIKSDAAYYKAKEEQAIKDAQARGHSGGFKGRLKAGLTAAVKRGKANNKARKKVNMGLMSTNQSTPGPQFGLSNPNATNISVNNRKKGPFDL